MFAEAVIQSYKELEFKGSLQKKYFYLYVSFKDRTNHCLCAFVKWVKVL